MLEEQLGSSGPVPGSGFGSGPAAGPGWLWECGAAVLAGCVCAAAVCVFLLYRAFRGRLEGSEQNPQNRENQQNRVTESTEVSADVGSEEAERSANHTPIASNLPEEDVRETILENQNEPPETGSMRGSGGTLESLENEKCETESMKVEVELLDYQSEGGKPAEDELKESTCAIEECEAEPTLDVDETSETESAQETLEAKIVPVRECQSMEDLLDSTLLAQDDSSKFSTMALLAADPSQPEADHKAVQMDEEEVELEDHRFSQVNEIDCCCYEEQPGLLTQDSVKAEVLGEEVKSPQECDGVGLTLRDTLDSRSFDSVLHHAQHSYLGFTMPILPVHSQAQLPDASKENSEVVLGCNSTTPTQASCNKNEISIMEAIMDSNEWLSTGPPDTKEVPCLTQAQKDGGYGLKTKTSGPSNTVHGDSSWLKPDQTNTNHGLIAEERQLHQEKAESLEVTGEDDEDLLSKKVAAVSPMPQMVRVSFRVHYVTHSPNQLLAVTGNQQELGAWESFVPLQRVEDWFWANSVPLPAEKQVEWKFVLVEDGKIRRWEECSNRHLVVTGQEEEIRLDKSWAYM